MRQGWTRAGGQAALLLCQVPSELALPTMLLLSLSTSSGSSAFQPSQAVICDPWNKTLAFSLPALLTFSSPLPGSPPRSPLCHGSLPPRVFPSVVRAVVPPQCGHSALCLPHAHTHHCSLAMFKPHQISSEATNHDQRQLTMTSAAWA